MNDAVLLHLLALADGGLITPDTLPAAAAHYRQACRVIDRDRGEAVLLTRERGPVLDLAADVRRYCLTVIRITEGPCIDFTLADRVARSLFGDSADLAVATVDTFVPGSVSMLLAVDKAWQPVAWPLRMAPPWIVWPARAALEEAS